jgi:hypothetical protein
VTASTNEGTMNTEDHMFTENGEFTFIATDSAGNITERTVVISNIDKTPPIITGVEPYSVNNRDITISFNEGDGTIRFTDLNDTGHNIQL